MEDTDWQKYMFSTASPDRYKMMKEHNATMRVCGTEAENLLWNAVRGKKLGVKFRRQHMIGDYVADFVCLEKKLIIEADGKYHYDPRIMEHDRIRDSILNNLGYTILRFTNDEILNNMDSVTDKIFESLDNLD